MANILPPPPTDNNPASPSFRDWYYKIQQLLQNVVLVIINAFDSLTTGIIVKTGTSTYATRSIVGTTSRIDVSNGDGIGGNPTVNISTGYVGQTSITTLGTISIGLWQGDTVGSNYGGTGFSTYTTGDIIYASASNTLAKLAAGTNGEVLTLVSGVPSWEPSSSSSGYPQHTLQSDLTVETYESYIVTAPLNLNGFTLTMNGRLGLI